jgi:hypothetical protein
MQGLWARSRAMWSKRQWLLRNDVPYRFLTHFAFPIDGVHIIHQLTQVGRTLVSILLNCKSEALQYLISPSLDALRSCVGLLRRFSDRYVCGVRSGELSEEFCRCKFSCVVFLYRKLTRIFYTSVSQIPLEPSAPATGSQTTRVHHRFYRSQKTAHVSIDA